MPPPRASSAPAATDAITAPGEIAAAIEAFFNERPDASALEEGKVCFDMREAQWSVSTEHGRCVLHLWSGERNLVRSVVSATLRRDALRLATMRFGQKQPKLLELVRAREVRTPTARDTVRTRYVKLLERVLEREFPEWRPESFRTAMDLERSFGPAYARGVMVRGNQAWAVIGVNADESAATIDGVLTLGILWLDHCRAHAGGRRLFQGLRVMMPRGSEALTLSRMAWLREEAAQWELFALDEASEGLVQRDLDDTGNLRTRLVHHPDEAAARERFAGAVEQVMSLVPASERERVDQQLRSTAELAFLLHGLEFARARIGLAPNSFMHTLEVSVGAGAEETRLSDASRESVKAMVHELFARRRAQSSAVDYARRGIGPTRRIGQRTAEPAHSRMQMPRGAATERNAVQDPLYRAAPERWLESVLRRDIAPLTRGLAVARKATRYVIDDDCIGNRAEVAPVSEAHVLPTFDGRFLYAQVPAIAGASDRGLLDLLGMTADGRLAVIELKADEDLQFALQGLDYWIRVRQHHLAATDVVSGLGEFQRHGYFVGAQLSPLAPRLYLVAPALRIHPATEIVLRYVSPRVEWQLIAIDERWREQVRVVWRKGPSV